jgi:hypothetical protein
MRLNWLRENPVADSCEQCRLNKLSGFITRGKILVCKSDCWLVSSELVSLKIQSIPLTNSPSLYLSS